MPKERKLAIDVLKGIQGLKDGMKIDDDSNSSPTLRGKVYKKALASKPKNVLAATS